MEAKSISCARDYIFGASTILTQKKRYSIDEYIVMTNTKAHCSPTLPTISLPISEPKTALGAAALFVGRNLSPARRQGGGRNKSLNAALGPREKNAEAARQRNVYVRRPLSLVSGTPVVRLRESVERSESAGAQSGQPHQNEYQPAENVLLSLHSPIEVLRGDIVVRSIRSG